MSTSALFLVRTTLGTSQSLVKFWLNRLQLVGHFVTVLLVQNHYNAVYIKIGHSQTG